MKFVNNLLVIIFFAAFFAYVIHRFRPDRADAEYVKLIDAGSLSTGPQGGELTEQQKADAEKLRKISPPARTLVVVKQQMPLILGDLNKSKPLAPLAEWQALVNDLKEWNHRFKEGREAEAARAAMQLLTTVEKAIVERDRQLALLKDTQKRHAEALAKSDPKTKSNTEASNKFMLKAQLQNWERSAKSLGERMQSELNALEQLVQP